MIKIVTTKRRAEKKNCLLLFMVTEIQELLFTGSIPRGVFCEWSKAKVTENSRVTARRNEKCAMRTFHYNQRRFLPFLCIAKHVAGHGVNSNMDCAENAEGISGGILIAFSGRE